MNGLDSASAKVGGTTCGIVGGTIEVTTWTDYLVVSVECHHLQVHCVFYDS